MTNWPDEYGRIVMAEVGSTLDEALVQTATHPAPFWLLSHRQTAARGRRGRAWRMPEGNFAATLIIRATEPVGTSALRSFVMSLALYRAMVQVTGQDDAFSLKWPNDVLLNGGKVAGILLESGGAAGHLAIGVGVNLMAAPDVTEVETHATRPVSILSETGVDVKAEAFLAVLATQYATLEEQFKTYGFAPVRTGWLAHAARLGEVITARSGKTTSVGTFEDVDPEGQLVLRGPRGVQKVAAADVYF